MSSNQHTHRQEIPQKPLGNNYAMMQMQAIIWVAQTQMQRPSVHVLSPSTYVFFQVLIPFYSSILLFYLLHLDIFVQPTSPSFHILCQSLPVCHQFPQNMTPLDIYIHEMLGLTPLGILGRHHTWWRWSLEVFLDCFYELPSLWLEQVDLHKLINQ